MMNLLIEEESHNTVNSVSFVLKGRHFCHSITLGVVGNQKQESHTSPIGVHQVDLYLTGTMLFQILYTEFGNSVLKYDKSVIIEDI